jgi:putative sigma-54 modulation protein
MRISYTGIKQDLPAKIQKKLDAKFAKLSRLLEKRGEQEAHVVITMVRHLHKAEVTIQFYNHKLVGQSSDVDLFTAIYEALDKLEIQAVKNREKWQERRKDGSPKESAPVETSSNKSTSGKSTNGKSNKKEKQATSPVNVFQVNHHDSRKPMTLDEAMLEMEEDRDYLVYRDADKERVSVLVRRRDGHFDLIES